jgi:hypothetical protein
MSDGTTDGDAEEAFLIRDFAETKYRPASPYQSARPGTDLAMPWWQTADPGETIHQRTIYFSRATPPASPPPQRATASPRRKRAGSVPPTLRDRFEASRARGQEARTQAFRAVGHLCNRWLAAMFGDEYRALHSAHTDANARVRAAQEQLDAATSTEHPALEARCATLLAALQTCEGALKTLREEERQVLLRAALVEKRLAEESSHLVAPINRTLDCIYSEHMFAESKDTHENTLVFTAECLESLVPKLPPRPAMIVYDPDAKTTARAEAMAKIKARRKKLDRDREAGIVMQRPARSVPEIVLTALALIANPVEFERIAKEHRDGSILNDDTQTHCARDILASEPFQLLDDVHFEDTTFVLHELAVNVVLRPSLWVSAAHIRKMARRPAKEGRRGEDGKHEGPTLSNLETRNRRASFSLRQTLENLHASGAAARATEDNAGDSDKNTNRFFDPLPLPWQLRELSHVLGGPFETALGHTTAETFDPVFLQMRENAMKSLSGDDPEEHEHEHDPWFLLLRFSLGILHLWRSLYNLPETRAEEEQQENGADNDFATMAFDAKTIGCMGLGDALALRKWIREDRRTRLMPLIENATAAVSTAADAMANANKALAALQSRIGNLNLRADGNAIEAEYVRATEELQYLSGGASEAQILQWETPDSVVRALLHACSSGAGSVVLTIRTGSNVGSSRVGSTLSRGARLSRTSDLTESSKLVTGKVRERLGLVDSASAYLRFMTAVVRPAAARYGGILLCTGGGHGCSGVSAGIRTIRMLFSGEKEKTKEEEKKNPFVEDEVVLTDGTHQAMQAADFMRTELAAIARNRPPRRRQGGEIAIPSLQERLGGVDIWIGQNGGASTHPNRQIGSCMVFGSGTGAVIREILKPRVPQSKSPPLLSHPNSTDANKDACRHSVSSVAFPPVMEFDRDLEDLNLCQALLEIAQSQERGRQGKQSDSSATAGSADALRMRLTKERAEEGFHVLCVRLVEENQGGRSGSGSLRQSSYCDQNAPAILSSLSGDMELDNDYFIVLLCCQEFCLGLESARQSQDNDNATEVLTMPALDKQTANPVQIFASASEDRLKDLDVRIRAEWGQRSRFERLGKNAVRDRIASKALAFRLESRLVQADNVGPILVNREEGRAASVHQFSHQLTAVMARAGV